jgi:hypothetical protein
LDLLTRVLHAYGASDRATLLKRIFAFYLIEAIGWAVGCRTKTEAEFAEALAQLRTLRNVCARQ